MTVRLVPSCLGITFLTGILSLSFHLDHFVNSFRGALGTLTLATLSCSLTSVWLLVRAASCTSCSCSCFFASYNSRRLLIRLSSSSVSVR